MKVLFVNGCIRGAQSRTLQLAEQFLTALRRVRPDAEIAVADLNHLRLTPLYEDTLAERDACVARQDWHAPLLLEAARFREADLVVLAAPFWEGTFPSALHTYIEHICVAGLTFRYGEDEQPIGLCRAERAVFFTTKGGCLSETPEADFAAGFLGCNLRMLGIGQLDLVEVEGLDIQGADVPALLEAAGRRAQALAQTFADGQSSRF